MLADVSQAGALVILFLIWVLGEVVPKVTKGKIPGPLVITVLMIAGFWTILPKDIIVKAGLTPGVYSLCSMLVLTHMGTLIGVKEMGAQWRTVVINLMGLAIIVLISLSIGAAILGWNNAIAVTGPLTGGVVAVALTMEVAGKISPDLALIALISLTVQGLIGYPLTNIFLGKEAKRLNKLYEEGNLTTAAPAAGPFQAAEITPKKGFLAQFATPAFIILKLLVVALLAYWIELLITKVFGRAYISRWVWCLVLGFVFSSVIKFLERDALTAANSYGITLLLMFIMLFGQLNAAQPSTFLSVLVVTFCFTAMAAVGMGVMAFIASKIFRKVTFPMCYSIILCAYYGFPINVMLTNEAVEGATKDPKAREAIRGQVLPQMLIGGFTSVTVVSVLITGVLVTLFRV